MPELSRFYGIVIRMFVEAGGSHHLPHQHAYYQEHVGIYAIDPIELIAGSLPRRHALSLRGQSFTGRSYSRVGRLCKVGGHPLRLNR